jgi:hypothetical protein
MKVLVRYADGRFWMEEYTQRHADAGLASVDLDEGDWYEYQDHLNTCQDWQDFMLELSNELAEKDETS